MENIMAVKKHGRQEYLPNRLYGRESMFLLHLPGRQRQAYIGILPPPPPSLLPPPSRHKNGTTA